MSTTADFKALFLNDTPLMDVRAPIEFAKGAFPCATNVPLLDDPQREQIGTCYKEQGQDAAIELGNELATQDIKTGRIEAWQQYLSAHPQAMLYCFRGGLRSRISQQWLAEAGVDIPFVAGGYKALRNYLLDVLQQRIADGNILVLSGATGSGKTEVIQDWPQSVDLEGLANHRGSAFGGTGGEQPSQIDFENAWAVDWLKLTEASDAPVLFEDESRLIGRIAVMPEYLALSKKAPIVLLKAPLQERIERIRRDYCQQTYQHYLNTDNDRALGHLDDYVRTALNRIRKRLGGERFQHLNSLLDTAVQALASQNSWSYFDDIIEVLLNDYYDPMYQYQFQAKASQQVFEGTHQEILQWLPSQQRLTTIR